MTGTIPGDLLRQWLERARMIGASQATIARGMHMHPGTLSRWKDEGVPPGHAAAVVEALRRHGVTVQLPRPGWRVFLAAPMAALGDEYEQHHAECRALYALLSTLAGPVYWAGAEIEQPDRFEAPDLATERNLRALAEVEALVYFQPGPLSRPSSALVELGMALQRHIPVVVFAPDEDSLPFMLRRFDSAAARLGMGRYRFHPADDAVRLLDIHGAELLGLPAQVAA